MARKKITVTPERKKVNGGGVITRWAVWFWEDGKRRRQYFPSKAKAEEEAEKREGFRQANGDLASIAPEETATVNEAREELESLGLSLREAVESGKSYAILRQEFEERCLDAGHSMKAFLACHDRLHGSGATVEQILEEAIARHELASRSATISDLIAEFLAEKATEGRSQKYQRDLRVRLAQFESAFGKRPASTVETGELSRWLGDLRNPRGEPQSARSVNSHRRYLSVLFNFAKVRRYCLSNPIEGALKPKEVETDCQILTSAEMTALLHTANPELIPCLVLGGFAGLRQEEILGANGNEAVDWSHINLDRGSVRVPARSKTGRRLVKLEPNAIEWLRPFKRESGRVAPVEGRHKRLVREARRKAGLQEWPKNGLRHSYGSYFMGRYHNASLCAEMMGNSPLVVKKHYQELVDEHEAQEWWSIVPAGSQMTSIVPFNAA